MNTTGFLQALAMPLRQPVLLIAAVVFWTLGAFGWLIFDVMQNVLPFVGWLTLLMTLAFMVPALIGYLLQLTDAASRRQKPPVADAELFLMMGRDWRVFPLLPVAAMLLLFNTVASAFPTVALLLVPALAMIVLPLHLMLLTVTGSRIESVNPLAMFRLLGRLWPAFLWFIPVVLLAAFCFGLAIQLSGSAYLLLALAVYWSMAVAAVCGGVLTTIDIADETDIGEPLTATEAELNAATLAERNKVLGHAYGLISRGNRDGGFAHIDKYVTAAGENARTAMWFYFAMQNWDLGDVPLFYGQRLIGRLLDAGEGAAALKVLTACLHRNETFRPESGDRHRLRLAAEEFGNSRIRAALARMP